MISQTRRFLIAVLAFCLLAGVGAACDGATQSPSDGEGARTTTTTVPPRVQVTPFEADTLVTMTVGGDAVDHPDTSRASFVTKWNKDIVVALEGTPTPEDRVRMLEALASLAPLVTPLRLRSGNARDANVVVHFAPKSEWTKLLHSKDPISDQVGGVARPSYSIGSHRGRITKATVVIDPEMPQVERNPAITHELIHALGLGHVECGSSIMDPSAGPLWALTPLDQRMVGLLYRPEIEAGDVARDLRTTLVPSAPVGATCEGTHWELARDEAGAYLFCQAAQPGATGVEAKYRACTRDVSHIPQYPLQDPDLYTDGEFLYRQRPAS